MGLRYVSLHMKSVKPVAASSVIMGLLSMDNFSRAMAQPVHCESRPGSPALPGLLLCLCLLMLHLGKH